MLYRTMLRREHRRRRVVDPSIRNGRSGDILHRSIKSGLSQDTRRNSRCWAIASIGTRCRSFCKPLLVLA